MEDLENKTQETIKKKQSVLDKIVNKSILPLAILSVAYLVHLNVCNTEAEYYFNQLNKTHAYQEFVKAKEEITDLNKMTKDYSTYLSKEGKQAIEKRVVTLTEKNKQLSKEIRPYAEKIDQWGKRRVNPLEYFK